MRNKQNNNIHTLTALLESDCFLKLDPVVQQQILDTLSKESDNPCGLMGKLLGSKPANLAIHVVLILCLALLLVILVDNLHAYRAGNAINMELVTVIIPVISLAIGYIFGRCSK